MRIGHCLLSALLPLVSPTELARADAAAPRSETSASETLRDSTGYSLHGVAKPAREAKLSAALTGVLDRILVAEGDVVQRDQVLAVIDDRVARKLVRVAEAAADQSARIRHAEQALALARSRLERLGTLQRSDAVTTYELEEAGQEVRQAEANLDTARQQHTQALRQLELEQARLDLHSIRAPFAGKVVRVHATIGEAIHDGHDLLTLVDMESLKVELHLPLEWYERLVPGRRYPLAATAPLNRQVPGSLDFVSPRIDSPTQTFRCVFSIDNRDLRLPSGFDVRLDSAWDKQR